MAASARAADDAMRQLQSEPAGPVVVKLSRVHRPGHPGAAAARIPGCLAAISVQLLVSNRRVDLISEGWTSRCGSAPSSTRTPNWWCATWAPRAARWSPAGLPATSRRAGHAQDLAAHTTLSFSDPQHEVRWPLRNDKGEEVHIELKPQLSCNDFIVLVEAAVRGRGIALLPSIATQEELRRGQLMPVLPQWQSPEGIVHCIYPRGAA